ncbi:MAG: 6-phosphofructokinase [Deferribacterales bacterium]|nr:6-phosphofructokinase [Deferribacterales bacterium]
MGQIRNIGIITAGGDCGGLNAVVRGAASMALSRGVGAYVIPNGYAGLYNLVNIDKLTLLDQNRLEQINSTRAGSEAGHSRVKISKIKDPNKYDRILEGLKKFNIDGLVVAGGDDTGSVVVDLHENGIPVVHAPKTMDLDLQTYSVGGDSTINRIVRLVEDLKTTGRTHDRIMITEVFGRYAGHTAFRGGVAADADCILIPEVPVDFNQVYAHLKENFFRRILNSDVFAGTYTIVVAEGVKDENGNVFCDANQTDAFGHAKLTGAAKGIKSKLESLMKNDPEMKEFMQKAAMYVDGIFEIPEVREVIPGHMVRSGESTAMDANFGKEAGASAVMLLLDGITGVTFSHLTGDGQIRYMITKDAIKQRHVHPEMISFYENLGVCFGRKPQPSSPKSEAISELIDRVF